MPTSSPAPITCRRCNGSEMESEDAQAVSAVWLDPFAEMQEFGTWLCSTSAGQPQLPIKLHSRTHQRKCGQQEGILHS